MSNFFSIVELFLISQLAKSMLTIKAEIEFVRLMTLSRSKLLPTNVLDQLLKTFRTPNSELKQFQVQVFHSFPGLDNFNLKVLHICLNTIVS